MNAVHEAAQDAAGATVAPLFYSVAEARRMLGDIGVTKFYELVKEKRLRTCKLGTRTIIDSGEIRRFAAEVIQAGEA